MNFGKTFDQSKSIVDNNGAVVADKEFTLE